MFPYDVENKKNEKNEKRPGKKVPLGRIYFKLKKYRTTDNI